MPSTKKRPGRHRGHLRRNPGPVYSEAARRLWGILDDLDLETCEAAARVGVTDATVLRWLYGDKRADAAGQLACRREFGLEQELWFEDVPAKLARALPVSKSKAGAAA